MVSVAPFPPLRVSSHCLPGRSQSVGHANGQRLQRHWRPVVHPAHPLFARCNKIAPHPRGFLGFVGFLFIGSVFILPIRVQINADAFDSGYCLVSHPSMFIICSFAFYEPLLFLWFYEKNVRQNQSDPPGERSDWLAFENDLLQKKVESVAPCPRRWVIVWTTPTPSSHFPPFRSPAHTRVPRAVTAGLGLQGGPCPINAPLGLLNGHMDLNTHILHSVVLIQVARTLFRLGVVFCFLISREQKGCCLFIDRTFA